MISAGRHRADAPIGVFDSGLGGLTVVRRLQEMLPHERIVYVADQAHVPYGGRDLAQIQTFARGISEALIDYGCKAVVMACNISTATALPQVQADYPEMPVLGVIAPGAREARSRTHNGRIGVLATEGTVKTLAYTGALHSLDAALRITEEACPLFVPLVESGRESGSDACLAAEPHLDRLCATGVDTVILGCTHYPFLLPVLRRLRPELTFVDPASETVHDLAAQLQHTDLLRSADPLPAPHLLTTTGDVALFADQLLRFLPVSGGTVCTAQAIWEGDRLLLPV